MLTDYAKRKQGTNGAVSIFVVIFSALLITTIAIGFIRIMVQEQQQASAVDLSQSALDSANAGVEDAKRLLVRYSDYCKGSTTASSTPECNRISQALMNGGGCDTLQKSGIVGSPDDKEVLLRQSGNDADLQLMQAYTCVKIQLNTNDYVGAVTTSDSRIIPLKGTGDFDRIEVEWYSQADLRGSDSDSDGGVPESIDLPADTELPKLADWGSNRPGMLRMQLIQFGDSFQLSDFDKKEDGSSNARTLFLNPNSVGRDQVNFTDDLRGSMSSGSLQQISCDQTFSSTTIDKEFACKATIILPNAIGQNDLRRTAFLHIDTLYNDNTNFRIKLANSSSPVTFSSVQPIVDSTGRANDMFRRVQSRIEMDSSLFPFPQSAVDISSNLCKTFRITDTEYESGDCSSE
ncbi:hypothetical protein EON76_02320 [bacterium]|nr:MAG: hypothetical protein EON76_02320 [bacterium]